MSAKWVKPALPQVGKERMGEIALAAIKLMIRKEGLTIDPRKVRGDIGNKAKELNELYGLNTSFNELLGMYQTLIQEQLNETFAPATADNPDK